MKLESVGGGDALKCVDEGCDEMSERESVGE